MTIIDGTADDPFPRRKKAKFYSINCCLETPSQPRSTHAGKTPTVRGRTTGMTNPIVVTRTNALAPAIELA